MLKSDQLYQLHCRLTEVRQNNKEFASIGILLFGDLLQLRPVQGSYTFQKPKGEKYRKVSEVFNLWHKFQDVDLEHNHRQGEDKTYASLLNRLRYKSLKEDISDEDLNLLKSRILSPPVENDPMKIFGKNAPVNEENSRRLSQLQTPLHIIQATHIPKKRNVRINTDGTVESTAFLDRLHLKKGCAVVLINNV